MKLGRAPTTATIDSIPLTITFGGIYDLGSARTPAPITFSLAVGRRDDTTKEIVRQRDAREILFSEISVGFRFVRGRLDRFPSDWRAQLDEIDSTETLL